VKSKNTGYAIGYLEKKADQMMVLRKEEIETRKQEEVRSFCFPEQQDMLKIIQQQQEKQEK